MKKLLLSSAIAATMGTAGFAQAAVDLDKPNGENPITFAEEIAIGSGVNLDVGTAGDNGGGDGANAATQGTGDNTIGAAQGSFGFTIGQGTSKYVRLSFDEPLGSALAEEDFGAESGSAVTFSISQGGAAGDEYVIVEAAAPTGGNDILQDDLFIFDPQTGDEIVATSMNTRNLGYDLYETAVDAVNESNVLESKSAQWITWGPGYEVSCTDDAARKRIDVVEPTQFLDTTFASNVSDVTVDDLAVFTEAGVAVNIVTDYFSDDSTITIAGSTAAFTGANGFTLGGNNADAAPADDDAEFTTGANGVVTLPLSAADFAVNADTSNDMAPSTYSLSIVDDGDASYDVGTVTVNCGALQYSGSTDRLDFVLKPEGAYQQYARITNPSGTDGEVTVTVYNDEGAEVTFPLGDVAGADTILESDGSTSVININEFYNAATAADTSFELGAGSRNKLRIEVRGEFGDDAFEDSTGGDRLNGRTAEGIYIQGLTISNGGFVQTH